MSNIILTPEQNTVVNEAVKWWHDPYDQVFQYTGYAGTGKSVVLYEILKRLGINPMQVAPMSYIGQAAIIMRLKGLLNAKTIHSWLYSPVETFLRDKETGDVIMNEYLNRPRTTLEFEPKPLDGIQLMFNDEAGTTPEYIVNEMLSRGIKIIAAGDLGQLPPVEGKPGFLVSGKIHQLTQPMRQNENSPIYYLADRARKGLPIELGYYGPNCMVIEEDQLTPEMLVWSDMNICGKNATRDRINKMVRQDILKIRVDYPVQGERLICRKNNWNVETEGINLANGLIGNVINTPGVDGFDGKTLNINFKPNAINSAFIGIPIDYEYLNANHQQRQFIKNNKYSKGEKFEFAYCITAHSSQGGQYRKGIYMEEQLFPEIQNNLNYTGITRFSHGLIYVKKKRKFHYFK